MGNNPISFERLRILLSVAETGSLTDSAADLMMSVSAVSQQMSKLEKELKIPLIERLPRGVRLTDAGRSLAEHALKIDRNISAALAEIENYRKLNRGKVRISTFPTFAASVMPEIIRLYRMRHPNIEIEVKSTRQQAILDSLMRRETEVATLWDYPWIPFSHADLKLTPLMVEPTMLLVPKEHRLSSRKIVDMSELEQEKWITREDHPVASVLETICQNAGFKPNIAMLTNDYQELQGMVSAGIGLALAPKLAVINPNPSVKVIKIKNNPAPRRIFLARHAHGMISPSTHEVVKIFGEIAPTFSG